MMPSYTTEYIHSANSINTWSNAENPRAQTGSSFENISSFPSSSSAKQKKNNLTLKEDYFFVPALA